MSRSLYLSSVIFCLLVTAGCTEKPEKQISKVELHSAPVLVEKIATKNAYFGDLHVHTKNSFDAFITGTRTNADDAYRFAKGDTIDNGAGKNITISGAPLDFYGVTDHGEYMGVLAAMRDRGNPLSKTDTAKSIFGIFGGSREARIEAFTKVGTTIVTGNAIEDIYDRDFIDSAWAENILAAEKHYEPGKFTTFAAYEYTNMNIIGKITDNAGAINLHRNVVFRDKAPERLFSTLDSTNPEDLWNWMNDKRDEGFDVLAIPHNSNASNGEMFSTTTTDGSLIDKAYAENRLKNEPIVEMTQVKGTSETHPLLSPEDEFANHELYEILVGMAKESQKVPGSFVRQSLSRGIGIEQDIGTNPYAFGFIGSSDTHVSAPSLSEEEHFGKFSHDTDLANRGSVPPDGKMSWDNVATEETELAFISSASYGASGLAGVWAESNTREDIFDAMKRKETFATSGPRIKARFFAGNYENTILSSTKMLEDAYEQGTPMGGVYNSKNESPVFIAWAIKDPDGYPLQRIQIIKVWSDESKNREEIYDISCAGGAEPSPQTNRCPDNGATVNLTNCKTNDATGSSELKALWSDPNYKKGQNSAYYIRVLENPKCRWSTWDAVRNGTPPNPNMQATLQDRAWSSAIWTK
ncbi:MAG: DUF3604 domain-containing protein [Hellea sp.]|jgi:hypothetical protein|nr:DUF3604 domain-containing protein [Hellea sp.]